MLKHAHRTQRILWVLIAVAIFLADQATKRLVTNAIPDHAVIPIIPGWFNLIHTENSGMAFSLFADSSSALKTVLLIAVALGLLITVAVVWRSRETPWVTGAGLALIVGGAVSNLLDRIRFGQVVDFLDVYYRVYHWPTFNLADSAIVVGAGFLILELFFSK